MTKSPNIEHLLHERLVDSLRASGVADPESAAAEVMASAKEAGAGLRAARQQDPAVVNTNEGTS